jgi:uncharacterized protein YndB with AHSA1/START domain
MTEAAMKTATQDIVVEELLPHAPEAIWKTLTTGELIDHWLMKSTGFAPVKGARFTFQTTPAGAWDGVIHCEVLEVMRSERLSYSWRGGHDDNAQYGSRLDTIVTWTLAKVVRPKNDTAFRNLSQGWKKLVGRIHAVSSEQSQKGIP